MRGGNAGRPSYRMQRVYPEEYSLYKTYSGGMAVPVDKLTLAGHSISDGVPTQELVSPLDQTGPFPWGRDPHPVVHGVPL